jgi:hypothetical protein
MATVEFFYGYSIKNQWLNFSLYFINFMYKTKNKSFRNKVCRFITSKYRIADNEQPIGAKQKNNKWLANGNYIKTAFIEVDKTDFINFYNYKNTTNNQEQLGFRLQSGQFLGNYKRAENPASGPFPSPNITNQERDSLNSNVWNDGTSYYFLKGANDNDIFKYLIDAGIV